MKERKMQVNCVLDVVKIIKNLCSANFAEYCIAKIVVREKEFYQIYRSQKMLESNVKIAMENLLNFLQIKLFINKHRRLIK